LDCRYCAKARAARYRAEHPEKARSSVARCWSLNKQAYVLTQKDYAQRERAKLNAIKKKYEEKHPDRVKATRARYKKSKSHVINAGTARRRASKLRATPLWAIDFFITEAYDLARMRTKTLGFKWHVDHIVPLQSEIVCGLHCENNLQVVPAFYNLTKGNTAWPDMPRPD